MELLINLFCFLLLLFLALVAREQNKWRGKKLPPGPWRLPFLGSMHHLYGGAASSPLRRLRDLAQKYGPLMHVQLGQVCAVVVSSPDMAKSVLKTHDLAFASRPKMLLADIVSYNSSDIVFCPYGDYWRQMRKICVVEVLSTRNVQGFSTIRRQEVSRLLDFIRLSGGRPVNLTEKVFQFTSSMTCRSAFGCVFKEQDEFIALIKEVLILLGGFDVADIFPSLKFLHGLSGMKRKILRVHNRIDAIVENVIGDHRRQKKTLTAGKKVDTGGSEDLIDVLLRMMDTHDGFQFPITIQNVKAIVFDLFTAGTETSSTTVVWAMVEMLRNPSILAKAQAEVRQAFKGDFNEEDVEDLKYLKLVIKETLRLHPPSPLLIPRECREETEINGYKIPPKTWVLVNVWSISRDPAYWDHAESFLPERFENSSIDFSGNNFEFLPFGGGRRICPGMSFGLANVILPLAKLLFHFDWELPQEPQYSKGLDLTESSGITAGKKDDLYLVATPYNPMI
ncbi:premnaspirodiene oxygenase-like [Ipomoea triloba]|uniref:premnaspirodiene oxygenase-like n=1 Tax=Ipomoea triloba TaxID=35885 RepID=UPI00125CD830|nr:premnaspirodiene oxygenase-like [Ipomoea triloba]